MADAVHCTTCGADKDRAEFERTWSAGSRGRCRACKNAKDAAWYERNGEAHREAGASYRAAKRAVRPPRESRDLRITDPPRFRKIWRARKYGLTEEQYDAMVLKQAGCCAVCGEGVAVPHIDHDHETGEVRGLLCGPCNLALGHLKDDPERAMRAAAYLLKTTDVLKEVPAWQMQEM